jgi:hypothetical protein
MTLMMKAVQDSAGQMRKSPHQFAGIGSQSRCCGCYAESAHHATLVIMKLMIKLCRTL